MTFHQIPLQQPSMPPQLALRYIVEMTRAGKTYRYVRVRGRLSARLPDDPNSPEFLEAYAAELRRMASTGPRRVSHADGSVGWLIEAYRASPAFQGLRPRTRQAYDTELARLEPVLPFPAADIRRSHLNAIRDTLADKPRMRQMFGQVCSLLWRFGIRELELDCENPAALFRRDGKAESYKPWTADQLAAFEASEMPTWLRTAYMLARYTGARRGDICRMTRADRVDGGILVAGSKTSNPIWVPEHPRLTAYLDANPAIVLVSDDRGSIRPERLSKALRCHCDAIGLDGCHLHGLRHTAGTALAEAGCSPHEIAAVLGHKGLQMVEHYTRRAAQRGLARSAIIKLGKG